jgi:membrane fusion protein (multidrug efflux system)
MIKRYPQWFILLLALLVIALVLVYNRLQFQAQSNRPMPVQAELSSALEVSVIQVETESYQARIQAYGTAQPHYNITLTSQVAGQIQAISEQFDSGFRIHKQGQLVQVDDRAYQATVAGAEADLADAELNLLEQQREAIQARAEWQAAGLEGEPDSPLVLRQPQLYAARAALKKAQANLESAQVDLENTRIRAPFDALVIERMVAPGSYVQAGTQIATLYSTERMEIPLPISSRDWLNLPQQNTTASEQKSRQAVDLLSIDSGQAWQGYVLRQEQQLDAETRQRTLIVAVDNPQDQSPALLPGSFVEAHIRGRNLDGLWQLPNSALSQRSAIWYVKPDHTLGSFPAQVAFSDTQFIYVQPPPQLARDSQSVLVRPLNSYLQGMPVKPVTYPQAKGTLNEE